METFFTTSDKVQLIIKSFNLTKTLFTSSIIIGEANTGKKTLVHYLFPETFFVSGKNQKDVMLALEDHDELIITDFEKLTNHTALDFNNKRIIAIANYIANPALIDTLFAFIYAMPQLHERKEAVYFLRDKFIEESIKNMMEDKENIDLKNIPINLSANSKSLKKTIYSYIMKQTMTSHDIEDVLYHYFLEHFEGEDNYRTHLGLYEKPLILAGLKKYGSQLKLSQVLGINRNTLRKKIHEHNIH